MRMIDIAYPKLQHERTTRILEEWGDLIWSIIETDESSFEARALIQTSESQKLIDPHPAIFLAPSIIGDFVHAQSTDYFANRDAFCQINFGFAQLRYDFFW